MRLWHYKLIPLLPDKQLLGQHRECCALRGLGWGKKHSTVDYVFKYSYSMLVHYHFDIINEMIKRNFEHDIKWESVIYRGEKLGYVSVMPSRFGASVFPYYPEHNDAYLQECIDNLARKGIIIRKEDIK